MRVETDKDFGTRECPSCAGEVAANENRCPVCGYEFPAVAAPSGPRAIVIAIVFAIAIVAILAMLIFGR